MRTRLFVSLIGIEWETRKWSAPCALYFHMCREYTPLLLIRYRSLRTIIIMQLIEYLILYLIICPYLCIPFYTYTYLRNIDKIGYAISIRIEKRTRERNQENKKYKISYIYYVDLCNTQLLLSSSLQSYSIVISKRNWVISSRLNRNRINNKKRYNKTVYRVTKL